MSPAFFAGGVHLLGSEALGDATNNVAEYTAVRNALRAAADAGVGSRADGLAGGLRPPLWGIACAGRAPDSAQGGGRSAGGRYPGRVTFARIPRERNGVADELAKDGARASQALSADRRR